MTGSRMKIVHCLFALGTGGAEVLAVELLNEMSKTQDVSLVIINDKYNPALIAQLNPVIKIHYLHRKEGSANPWPLIKLNMLLMKLRPDVIHCHEPKTGKAIRVRHAKLIYTIHDVGISTSTYHSYDGLVAISDAVYEEVHASFPNVRKIYNGVPIHQFKTRAHHNLETGKPFRMVQVSRLMHEKKGQDILLRAMSVLRQRGMVNFSLHLVGSGPSEKYLRDLTRELDLEEQVTFLGDKTRQWIFENLAGYDALIQPSRYEGFGLTIIEAFAAGIPVVASDIDGPAEILAQTSAGFLFRDGKSESCAEAVLQVVNSYQSNEIGALVEETLHVIKEKYSVETCSREYLLEYNRLKSVYATK